MDLSLKRLIHQRNGAVPRALQDGFRKFQLKRYDGLIDTVFEYSNPTFQDRVTRNILKEPEKYLMTAAGSQPGKRLPVTALLEDIPEEAFEPPIFTEEACLAQVMMSLRNRRLIDELGHQILRIETLGTQWKKGGVDNLEIHG